MPKLKACIFDMDGVIVNSADFHFVAWKQLASELSIELDDDFEVQLKGISRVDSLEKILRKGNLFLDNETKISLMEKKNEAYLDSISGLTKAVKARPRSILKRSQGTRRFILRDHRV